MTEFVSKFVDLTPFCKGEVFALLSISNAKDLSS